MAGWITFTGIVMSLRGWPSWLRCILPGAVLLLLSGCFRYVPLASGVEPAAGQELRMVLVPGDPTVERYFGPGAASASGRVTAVRGDSLALRIQRVDYGNNRPRALYRGQDFTLPRSAIHSMTLRKADTGRSLLLGFAIAGGVFGIGRLIGLDGIFVIGGGGGPVEPD